jgi:hypothetical protein
VPPVPPVPPAPPEPPEPPEPPVPPEPPEPPVPLLPHAPKTLPGGMMHVDGGQQSASAVHVPAEGTQAGPPPGGTKHLSLLLSLGSGMHGSSSQQSVALAQ